MLRAVTLIERAVQASCHNGRVIRLPFACQHVVSFDPRQNCVRQRGKCITSGMKNKLLSTLWLCFAFSSVATSFIYFEYSSIHSYVLMLGIAATINLFLALGIARVDNFSRCPVIATVLMFLSGQWWLLLWSLVLINWKIGGFAP